MAVDIFGSTPTALQRLACRFAAECAQTTSTSVSPIAFVDFMKRQLPTARNADLVWTWTALRSHISEHGKDPLKEAFKDAALLTLDEVTRLKDITNRAERLPEHKKNKTKESALHSFVIDNAKTVVQLFADKDKDEVVQVLKKRDEEENDTENELAFMSIYLSTPRATGLALGRGWLGSSGEVDTLDEDLREWLFKAMHDIYTVYKCCAFRLPLEEKESYYMAAIWSFLLPFFNQGKSLTYRPGEAISEASALRKNASRTLETRRSHGHKIVGLILSTMTQLEFGGIEAARTYDGVQGTKALMDTRKLAKLLKDMHDCIISKTDDSNALQELRTFGIQISRTKVTVYSLRKVPMDGPHYQLVDLGFYMFPFIWDESGLAAVAIARLLIGLVSLKKSMEAMDAMIAKWTVPGVRFAHEVLIPTLNSPLRSSDADEPSDS
ncbi:hypothetical protein EC968_006817 [Mortierella alpina]|nr:hypothetical protein EC968_006817 [Mortierella alpina]